MTELVMKGFINSSFCMIIDKIDKTAKFTGEAGCGRRLTWGICTIKRDFTQCIFIFLLFT